MSYVLAQRNPKQLKWDVRSTTLCVAAFILTMNIVATLVMVVAVLIENIDLIMAASAQSASSAELTADLTEVMLETYGDHAGLASFIGMLCGLPWFFILRGKKFLTSDITRVNSKVKFLPLVVMLICIFAVQGFLVVIQIIAEPFANMGGSGGESPFTDMMEESITSLALSPWGALYIVFLGPICEELVFRGAVMRKLEPYGANFAIVVSSLLFGLYHIILFQAMFAFFVGLVLAYVAGRFSLKWATLLHIINNGISVFSIYMGNEVFDTLLTVCFLACLVIAPIILVVKRKYVFAQQFAGAASEPKVFARAFTSPWLIGYIVLCVLGGVSLIAFS